MVTADLRPTQVLVDEQAIFDNIRHAQALAPATKVFAVVKADAYGHGLLRVARIAHQAKVSGFCVAVLEEALALRQAHFTEPILVLGIVAPELAPLAAVHDVALPVGDEAWLQSAEALLAAADAPVLKVHLAVDSGMGRIGFRQPEAIAHAAAFVKTAPHLLVEGLFTHFATADEADTQYFDQQSARFKTMLAALPERPRFVHVANSATSLWHQKTASDMIRFGVAMYGLNPSGRALPEPYPLKPALSLVSQLVFTKQLHAGDAVSYGATYHASQDEWIGTVPMGYADGWLRRMQGFFVLVDGHRCEIVGRVCMDQFMIRLPHDYPFGTPVVLVGTSKKETITLQDVADYAHTIHYEIACNLAERVPRRSISRL
ncbi:MAG: alanine racemase [Lactobacillus sp.]|jgi:alanine racemase|nr:alanine racemase [Lactobacillus sp.]